MVHAAPTSRPGRDWQFDGSIARPVLENYLARSINMTGMVDSAHLDDDLRMLKHVGAKHIGRVALLWWAGQTHVDMEQHFAKAREVAQKIHAQDPDCMLEAGVMETVGPGIDAIPIPAWVWEEFGQRVEKRNFDHTRMKYDDGYAGHGHDTIPPDVSKLESRMWFYYCFRRYIDIGYEDMHWGMIGLMDRKDVKHVLSFDLLTRTRKYARQHARRHMVLVNSQVPFGVVEDGKLLFDHHQMQLRPVDVVGEPEKCILKTGYGDTIYGRSKGGLAPSGWECKSLPYYIQFDNGFPTGKEGQNIGFPYAWGSCEIDWFARQPKAYRDQWMRYAHEWIRQNDPNGFLQMPGRNHLSTTKNGKGMIYVANTVRPACPEGYGQEESIKAIWSE